jgi:hypothetical protein
VASSHCDRRGRYSLAKLIAKHGPDKSSIELLRELSADCPHRESTSWQERCDPHCPELAALFMRGRSNNVTTDPISSKTRRSAHNPPYPQRYSPKNCSREKVTRLVHKSADKEVDIADLAIDEMVMLKLPKDWALSCVGLARPAMSFASGFTASCACRPTTRACSPGRLRRCFCLYAYRSASSAASKSQQSDFDSQGIRKCAAERRGRR